MENWSEEGTIKRVGLLLLLRRTRELSPYVRAKPVFHTIWEVASLSLSHLFNWSDSSGAGKVLRRHIYLLRWMSSVKSCSMCLSCLCCLAVRCGIPFLPCGMSYALRLLASRTAILSHLGRLPSQQEKLFSPCALFLSVLAAFHRTFADSTLSNQHHRKAIQRYQTLYVVQCSCATWVEVKTLCSSWTESVLGK